jgi:murein endopeptidase
MPARSSPAAARAATPAPGRDTRSAAAPHASEAHAALSGTRDDAPDTDDADEDDEEGVDDSFDTEPPRDATITPPHPFANVSDAELEHRLVANPASLGSVSIGKPSAGLLFNGKVMPNDDAGWTVVAGGQAFGTEETLEYLETAIHTVSERFPGSPKVSIGDISARGGGYLSPHLSHQSGRDADVGYYYLDGAGWYRRATAQNLDVTRTWALVRALITRTDVEMILIDHSVQALLRTEAERSDPDSDWLDSIFRGRNGLPPLIRHAPGHATHLHVRFWNPIAQETGRRIYPALVRHGMIHVGPAFAVHVAKKGDTLVELAKRYGTTVRAIRRANGLKSNVIMAKKSYRIPERGKAPPAVTRGPVTIPPRRLPSPRQMVDRSELQ